VWYIRATLAINRNSSMRAIVYDCTVPAAAGARSMARATASLQPSHRDFRSDSGSEARNGHPDAAAPIALRSMTRNPLPVPPARRLQQRKGPSTDCGSPAAPGCQPGTASENRFGSRRHRPSVPAIRPARPAAWPRRRRAPDMRSIRGSPGDLGRRGSASEPGDESAGRGVPVRSAQAGERRH